MRSAGGNTRSRRPVYAEGLASAFVLFFVFAAMLIFAAGMFTLHSVLSAFLNHLETERKGLINGLYVSAYYCGGHWAPIFRASSTKAPAGPHSLGSCCCYWLCLQF
jgi:hypothetical protein